MRRLLPLTFMLSGCLAHSSVPAPANALACAERIANGLGYIVTSRSSEGGEGSSVAQQPVMGDAAEPAIGVISASVWRDSEDGTRLAVRGDRYRERRNCA